MAMGVDVVIKDMAEVDRIRYVVGSLLTITHRYEPPLYAVEATTVFETSSISISNHLTNK